MIIGGIYIGTEMRSSIPVHEKYPTLAEIIRQCKRSIQADSLHSHDGKNKNKENRKQKHRGQTTTQQQRGQKATIT